MRTAEKNTGWKCFRMGISSSIAMPEGWYCAVTYEVKTEMMAAFNPTIRLFKKSVSHAMKCSVKGFLVDEISD